MMRSSDAHQDLKNFLFRTEISYLHSILKLLYKLTNKSTKIKHVYERLN